MKLLCMIAVFLCIPWVASDAQKQDWGNLKRYAEANKELVRKGKQKDRVVFMGNSITEGWVANDAAFFEDNGYVGRGIGGQTSSHFLLRFREDVIKLAPALAVALPRAVAQLALDRNLVSLCQETAHGLGARAEHSAVDKVGIVLPLASLRVAATIVHGDAKGQNLGSASGGAQLGITREVTGDVHSIDAHNSLLPLGAQAQSKTTVLLLVVATDDHVADHSVGDAQDAIKLSDLGRICVEVDEGVVTIGEVVDLVGELALAPLVNGVDLASALSDRGIDTLHNSETSLGVERRVNKEQQFISLHIVTSSGQMWLQVVKVRLKQEKT